MRGVPASCLAASKKANAGRKQSNEEIAKRALKQRKITPEQATDIIYKRKLGIYQYTLAREYGVSQRLIVRVEKGIGIYGSKDYFDAQEKRFKLVTSQTTLQLP